MGNFGGKPCVRNMRIRVSDILQMLGEGVSQEEILQDFPDLELLDIQACLVYAARRANLERLIAWYIGLMTNSPLLAKWLSDTFNVAAINISGMDALWLNE